VNLTVLHTYALQLEGVARLELAELAQALRQAGDRITALDLQADRDADRYLLQMQQGSTVDLAQTHFEGMDRMIAVRKGMEQAQTALQAQWAAKQDELLDAMGYRKKLDLLRTKAEQEHRRRQDRQDQQLLDERAWRRSPLTMKERP
jgi:flagellar export protein FliJ